MIPKIDSEIGILAYTTDFPGCGGTIKKQNEDFIVSEIITEKANSKICLESGFAVYKLQKNGIETRPVMAGNFVKQPVINLINHKISFVIMKITAILHISKIDSE